MRDRVLKIALAGLLHDVGKFAQRAGWQSGRHTEVGGEFVRQCVPDPWREHLYPVMGHHDPAAQMNRTTKIVALADRLSAGERADEAQAQPKQLLSIFCRLELDGQTAPTPRYWPLKPLALEEEVLYPQESPGGTYQALWAEYSRDAQRLGDAHAGGADLAVYLESMLLLMQRYTWCVPSAYYRSLPDVSLYDHSRTTAALAACFAGLDEGRLDALLRQQDQEEPIALLVGGDVSGVQRFIYTITARGAAKGLRGRSFYLQLLTEAVARYTLRQLGLPITNLLYTSGGHFYLLAPPSAAVRLQDVQAEIGRKLLHHHQGNLYLALGGAPLAAADFRREKFGSKWGEAGQAMNRAKWQRFADLDAETLREAVFAPFGAGGEAKHECQVCHYYGDDVRVEDEGTEDERRICPLCASLEELGTQLRDAAFLVLGEVEGDGELPRSTFVEALKAFGLVVGLTSAEGRPVRPLDGAPQRAALLAMHDVDDVLAVAEGLGDKLRCPVAAGTRYTVNVTPHRADGEIATFDWLQGQSRGVKRLGVLRMDVDDLGELFGSGLGENATLSRVSALSSALALFFEGWVGELCRQVNQQGADKVYAVYSGGDDLFIVGAWDVLPGLAHDIRRDLARFAAGNPLLHISGGLTLHGGKYPLYQAATDAEEALESAKDLERPGGRKKDAVNFLGLTTGWEEYETMAGIVSELVDLVQPKEEGGGGVPRALLQTLGALYAHYLERYEKTRVHWGPWMWRGTYNLSRLAARAGNARKRIEGIRDGLKQDDYRYIRWVGPAARWAELLTRKEQEK